MNGQTIHKTLMIAGGLLGLGLLYILFREKDETIEEAEFTIVEPPNATLKPRLISTAKKSLKLKVDLVKQTPIVTSKKKNVAKVKTKAPPEPNDDFPLKLGSKGLRVEQLQTFLLRNYGYGGLVTNDFDINTQKRIERFLKVKHVSQQLFLERDMDNSKKKNSYA